ncbi:MAG: hypothetical protein ACK46K_00255, partial [Gammaproteobacteria bacterium]
MSLNKTIIALAFALALTACSKQEEATDAAADATAEAAAATDAAAADAAAADAAAAALDACWSRRSSSLALFSSYSNWCMVSCLTRSMIAS